MQAAIPLLRTAFLSRWMVTWHGKYRNYRDTASGYYLWGGCFMHDGGMVLNSIRKS